MTKTQKRKLPGKSKSSSVRVCNCQPWPYRTRRELGPKAMGSSLSLKASICRARGRGVAVPAPINVRLISDKANPASVPTANRLVFPELLHLTSMNCSLFHSIYNKFNPNSISFRIFIQTQIRKKWKRERITVGGGCGAGSAVSSAIVDTERREEPCRVDKYRPFIVFFFFFSN